MILFFSNVNAKNYKVDDIVKDKLIINKKFQIKLPKGEWIVAESHAENYYGLNSKIITIIKLNKKRIVEIIEIAQMITAGVYEAWVNDAINEAMFKGKYDGCYERPEYTVVKFYAKGNTHNCFVIHHTDVKKELNNPDDPYLRNKNSKLKKWIKENKVELPNVTLTSNHSYFSRLAAGKWYLISFSIDPEILNAPKNKYINEELSEYNKNNIENYPKHKEVMNKWISISAQRHIEFEKSIKVINRHKLNFEDFNLSNF